MSEIKFAVFREPGLDSLDLLKLLIDNPGPHTAKNLSDMTGCSRPTVRNRLNVLASLDLVLIHWMGNARIYTAHSTFSGDEKSNLIKKVYAGVDALYKLEKLLEQNTD